MNAKKYNEISKNLDKFINYIPRDIEHNLKFRKELHSYLFEDDKARIDFMARCFVDPRIWFNTTLWTFNSQEDAKNFPFILWPHQEKAVLSVKEALDKGEDRFAKKSRKQGATYLILGLLLLYARINNEEKFLLGSRKEDLVDDNCEIKQGMVLGSEETLFYKLLYMLNTMPEYLKPPIYKKNLFLQFLDNGSAFKGDTTNIGFGKGFRGKANLIDEAAQIDPTICQWIIENLADTSKTSIFNSTNGPWGAAHPYSKLMSNNPNKVINLMFYDNPIQGVGRYSSPKEGLIVIKDVDYYRKKYINKYTNIEAEKPYTLDELPKDFPFIADGGTSNFGCDRTAWLDEEERTRVITPRGKAQNLLCIDSGSTDLFFSFELINKLQDTTRKPEYQGDINYVLNDNNTEIESVWFEPGGEKSIFSWWNSLERMRPDQSHNYVVGCDISKGTGTSNSVAAILDVNTDEIVGLLTTPYLRMEHFAEKVVALCIWLGGSNPPLLIWEENGASDFYERITELGYYNLYVKEDRGKKVKTAKKQGWRSTGGPNGTKIAMLNGLEAALFEGLRDNPRFTCLKLYDSQTIKEMEGYVYFEGKVDVGPASMQTETSGAKAAHGDRPIAVGLCVEGRKQQILGTESRPKFMSMDSFAGRMAARNKKIERERENGKVWFY